MRLRATGRSRKRNRHFPSTSAPPAHGAGVRAHGDGVRCGRAEALGRGRQQRRPGASPRCVGRTEPGPPGPRYAPPGAAHEAPCTGAPSRGPPGARQMSKVTTRASWSGGIPTAPRSEHRAVPGCPGSTVGLGSGRISVPYLAGGTGATQPSW